MIGTSAAEPSPQAAAEVFVVRPMVEGDIPFVKDSWLRSAWHDENRKLKVRGVKWLDRSKAGRTWYASVRPYVERIIAEPAVVVLVACAREDEAHIAGWVAIRAGREIRSHVKHAYRPWRVDALLAAAVVTATDLLVQASEAEELL